MIYTITGPSGSGKSTLVRVLLEHYPERFRRVVTSTTRKPRRGETDGIDYHFEERPAGGLEEWKASHAASAEFDGNLYGINTDDYEKLFGEDDSLIVLEPSGARELKERFPMSVHTVYVRISSDMAARHMKKRRSRYKKRQAADVDAGLFDDDGYDSVIDNDGNLDELVRRFLDILPDVQIVVAAGALPYVASTISTAGGRMFGEPYISVDGKTALFRADLPVPLKVSLLQNPNVFEISPVQYFSPS